ncbi:hypothetical protein [Plantactinospora endophytica]|uniref:Glycosyltransferase RgtA/B/C/D-like domain-containing protein n=1 Tax=Plantactinospora endophytica TaxID=673535 RepID=A0ABQ4DVB0_9ACTN|nr:hypothetical protein [Plantactinospora endophytica]GIG86399.1 hypothetical protein Pen02_13350 [Plantactinospora endophytica]
MALATTPELTEPPSRSVRRRPTPGWVAAGLGGLGVGYRLVLLLAEVPPSNSDEAVTGLVARHIAQGRDFPLFFYGQHYMGALESYLAAPLFAVLGSSTFALRLPNLLLYAAFLALMWQLTRRLYSPWLAAVTVGLLALGSDRILKNQLIAGGGYPEMNPAGALLVLLAVNLGLGAVRRTGPAYAGFGLVAGLTLWDDWLILPYVGAAGALLLGFRWRALGGRSGLALGAGSAVGLVPIVLHNLTAAPEHRSLAVYAGLGGGAGSWPDRLHGAVLFGLPMGTGLCPPGRCTPWQLWWGVAYPVLLGVAVLLAWRALRRATDRVTRVRQAGRLALLAGAATSLLAYAASGAAATSPVESARYLSVLLISTPAVLWPLWSALTRPYRPVRLAAAVPLAGLAVSMLLASASLLVASPELAGRATQRRDLVAGLDRLGVREFYTDYWTCNTVIFLSRERIVCGVIGEDLRAGWDRHPRYPRLVAEAPRPAFVLAERSALDLAVRAHLRGAGVPVTETILAGHSVYRPSAPVDLPLH